MDKKTIYVIGLVAIGIVAIISYLVYLEGGKPGDYDAFASCLTESGVVMAGTDWCHVCQDQKEMFGNSFKLIDFKNCDLEKQWCNERNVTGYPTWFAPDGTDYRGKQSFETLSQISGCDLGA